MNKITQTIFERTYQSYLCGGDVYTYRFESKSELMKKKYNDAIDLLTSKNLVEVKFKSDNKVRLILTEEGIVYGNSNSL